MDLGSAGHTPLHQHPAHEFLQRLHLVRVGNGDCAGSNGPFRLDRFVHLEKLDLLGFLRGPVDLHLPAEHDLIGELWSLIYQGLGKLGSATHRILTAHSLYPFGNLRLNLTNVIKAALKS